MNALSVRSATFLVCIAATATAAAQEIRRSEPIASSDVLSRISMFSYLEGPKSDLLFRGTPIAATAEGEAEVEYEDGNARISAKVERLPPPASLGPYMTYVLWALTPDGRAVNQGVLVGIEGGKGELKTTYGASQFALIVTAEPHFAVSVPSMMIALYNVADDVKGEESKVSTLTEHADYDDLAPLPLDEEMPPEVIQARYAVEIAAAAGAEQFAPEMLETAQQKLAAAEAALRGKRKERDAADDLAREAIVASEDARRASLVASTAAAAAAERRAAVTAATESERRRAEAATAAAASEATREELRSRLNTALPTRETDRGLVSEIGGVQFATGAAGLSPAARESLARFAGVVASYPGLRFNVEGHTDSTGSVEANTALSLERAIGVRDYLIGQGVPASRIDVAGLGPSQPIADNSTADGRARNRRVEIVISGEALNAFASSAR